MLLLVSCILLISTIFCAGTLAPKQKLTPKKQFIEDLNIIKEYVLKNALIEKGDERKNMFYKKEEEFTSKEYCQDTKSFADFQSASSKKLKHPPNSSGSFLSTTASDKSGSSIFDGDDEEFNEGKVVIKPMAKFVNHLTFAEKQLKFIGERYDKNIHPAKKFLFETFELCGGEKYVSNCWFLSFFKTNEKNWMIHGLWAQDNLDNKAHKTEDMTPYVEIVTNAIQHSQALQELIGIWFTPVKECDSVLKFTDMPYKLIADIWVYEYFKHSVASNLYNSRIPSADEFKEIQDITIDLANSAVSIKLEEEVVMSFVKGFIYKFPFYIVSIKKALNLVKESFALNSYHLLTHCKNTDDFQDCGVCMDETMTILMPCAPTGRGKY